MPALVDTNVLAYRFDHRFPEKQQIAQEVLRNGIRSGEIFQPGRTYGAVTVVNPFA